MKKKYNFNMKSMPKAYNNVGETILDVIGNYLFIIVLLVLCGLIHSNEDGRGYPLPWLDLDNNSIYVPGLILSFVLFGGLVLIAGITARIRRSSEIDYRNQYRDANVIANNSSNVVINDTDDFGVNVVNVSETHESSMPKLPTRKSKTSGNTVKSSNNDNVPLLNRNKKSNQKKNSMFLTVVISLVAFMVILSSVFGLFVNDYDDWDDDWDDSEFYDDESDSIQLVANDLISNYLIWEDSDLDQVVDGIGRADVDALYSYANWNSLNDDEFLVVYEATNGNEAIIKYSVDIDDEECIIAFKIVAPNADANISNIDSLDESDLEVTGISVVSGLTTMLDSDYSYGFDPSSFSKDEWQAIEDKVKNDSVSIGDCIIEDSPILLY